MSSIVYGWHRVEQGMLKSVARLLATGLHGLLLLVWKSTKIHSVGDAQKQQGRLLFEVGMGIFTVRDPISVVQTRH